MLVLQWNRMRRRTVNKLWWVGSLIMMAVITEVMSLTGPNVCMVNQKYNITKRVKYRAPMSVRTYEWCLAVPPRCSRYSTEMRDLTRLETEERTAEIAVCCPGYKMRGDFTCAAICPPGKTGAGCSSDCPPDKWGPNCVHDCKICSDHGKCSPITGECVCHSGWQGESCATSMSTTTTSTTTRTSLLTTPIAVLTTSPIQATSLLPTTTPAQRQTNNPTRRTSLGITEVTRRLQPDTFDKDNAGSKVTDVQKTDTFGKDFIAVTTESATASPRHIYQYSNNVATKELGPPIDISTSNDANAKGTTIQKHASDVIDPKESSITTIFLTTAKDVTTSSAFDNSTTVPWTFVSTKGTVKPFTIATTTSATIKTYTSKSTITTRAEIPKKVLPYTREEFTTRNTSMETATSKTTKKPEPTKIIPTTLKFKPKEIWIKPAQKGEIPIIESKVKSHELSFSKSNYSTAKELPSMATTPRPIILSIIPTSMSYSTFKKITLTTASAPPTQQYKTSQNKSAPGMTATSFSSAIATPYKNKIKTTIAPKKQNFTSTTAISLDTSSTLRGSKATPTLTTKPTESVYYEATNSMSMTNEVTKLSYSPSMPPITSTHRGINFTLFSGIAITPPPKRGKISTPSTTATTIAQQKYSTNDTVNVQGKTVNTTLPLEKKIIYSSSKEKTNINSEAPKKSTASNTSQDISTNTVNNSENEQDEEETFNILTEPEHITAVAGDRPSEIPTVDLFYVLSIVGGMVMTIITIAVVIVMFERCKRQRYGDLIKMSSIRMQVVIDNNDSPPPPYVRSIFHSPLPDPPTSEKCHYQPISTLDRNLKQFMRPVVVQAISPLMLENFRGILECHYDHLPIRSHDFQATECGRRCCSVTPSVDVCPEPHSSRGHSITDSTLEALKCEAKLDEIETSEPLYAEIPCWRPPSEHAVEILNVNGEAMTEL